MYRNMLSVIAVIAVTLSLSSCISINNVDRLNDNKSTNEELDLASYDTGIDYDMLMSASDDYIGKKMTISGKVLQVSQDGNKTTAKIAVDNDFDKIVTGTYNSNFDNIKIFDNDIITIRGVYSGIMNYNTVLGTSISIPNISVDKIEINY